MSMSPPSYRVCGYNFVEAAAPEDVLKRCSQCQVTYYRDRSAQMKHWSFHKMVCCSAEQDRGCDEFEDIEDVLAYIQSCLEEPDDKFVPGTASYDVGSILKGKRFLCALKELKRYCHEHPNDDTFPMAVRARIEGWLFRSLQDDTVSVKKIQLIWSTPGFANYMLSEEVLLSPAMQERRDNKNLGVEELKEWERLAPFWHEFLVRFYYRTCLSYDNPTVREPQIQKHPLAVAVMRQVCKQWTNPHIRAGIPDQEIVAKTKHWLSLPVSDFFYMMFKAAYSTPVGKVFLRKHTLKDELLPGLEVKDFFIMVLTSNLFLRFSQDPMATDILTDIYNRDARDQSKGPFASLSIQDRLELIDLYHHWDAPDIRMMNPDVPMPHAHHIRDNMLERFLGGQCKYLIKLHEAIHTADCSRRTKRMIRKLFQPMEDNAMIFARVYVECVEPQYQARQAKLGEKALPFPEELIQHIAQYRFPTFMKALVASHMDGSGYQEESSDSEQEDGEGGVEEVYYSY